MSESPVTLKRVPVRMHLPPTCERVTPVIRARRTWEPAVTQWLLEGLRSGDTFVDVGAHVGYFTLIAAKIVGEEGRVFAFEPDPGNFAILRRNVELNGFRNVVLENRAAAARAETCRLYLSVKNTGDHRLAPADEPRSSVGVSAVRLDTVLKGIGRVDFLKVDTQGAEVAVLTGARHLLRTNAGLRLVVEFWPYGLDRFGATGTALLNTLASCDFLMGKEEMARLLSTYTVENRRHTNLMLSRPRFEVPS